MIRECANPDCHAEFLYAHEGRLFPYEIRNPEEPCRDVPAVICRKKPGHAVVYFWLCEQCCQRFTLQFTITSGVKLALKRSEHDRGQDPKPSAGVGVIRAAAGERYA